MSKKMDWFRLYPEIRRDPKIRRLDPEERWLWITLLCIASDSPKRGHLLISEEFPYESTDIADEAALPIDATEQGLDKFMKFALLDCNEDGVYYLPKWDDRQYDNPSDTPEATRERQRRSRARKKQSREGKKADTSDQSINNDHVTIVSRPSHETESDTDTDTESETDSSGGDTRAREGEVFKKFKETFLIDINDIQRDKLGSYLDDGMEPELIERAMEITRENSKDINYFWGVLNRTLERGIKTIKAYELAESQRRERASPNASSREHDAGTSRAHKPVTGGKVGWLNRPTGSGI